MRLTAIVCVALAASLCLTIEHASAQSCDNYHSLIDSQRIDVTETSALIGLFGRGIRTPEEFARAQARTGGVSGATSIVLHCLPDTQCVHTVGGGVKMNLLQLLRSRDELQRRALAYQRAVAGLGRAGATSSFRANEGAVDRGYRLPHVSARAPVAEW